MSYERAIAILSAVRNGFQGHSMGEITQALVLTGDIYDHPTNKPK